MATVGRLEAFPNLVNVIAQRVSLTVDLRNTDDEVLQEAEQVLGSTPRKRPPPRAAR